jgi:hypothetical protein
MASAFCENAVNPFSDLISVILGFLSVNGTALGYVQSYSTKSYNKISNSLDKGHEAHEGVNSSGI